jgi:hypothetical protein
MHKAINATYLYCPHVVYNISMHTAKKVSFLNAVYRQSAHKARNPLSCPHPGLICSVASLNHSTRDYPEYRTIPLG